MSSVKFDFGASALCLDFANTADWHASDQPTEMLNDISDLIAWGVGAGLLDEDQGRQAAAWAEARPDAATIAFDWAIWLREVVYRLFAGIAHGRDDVAEDLDGLNDVLAEALAQSRLVATGDGYDWGWTVGLPGVVLVTWAVARSAADLLTSEQLGRVKQCADDRGCGYLFIDTSRNRSRRWCSMESCGNRAKARRHYEKLTADS